jgi:hypothetical protein
VDLGQKVHYRGSSRQQEKTIEELIADEEFVAVFGREQEFEVSDRD